MKRAAIIVFFPVMVVLSMACTGGVKKTGTQQSAGQGTPQIAFREFEHNFGKVTEGEKVSWQFLFENKGNADLVIQAVSTTCGCTVSKYDKKPLKPGESGVVEAIFDTSGWNGMQTKTITVKSNASVPVVILKILAEVEPGK
jgi:hypothetical protein